MRHTMLYSLLLKDKRKGPDLFEFYQILCPFLHMSPLWRNREMFHLFLYDPLVWTGNNWKKYFYVLLIKYYDCHHRRANLLKLGSVLSKVSFFPFPNYSFVYVWLFYAFIEIKDVIIWTCVGGVDFRNNPVSYCCQPIVKSQDIIIRRCFDSNL